MILIFQSVPTGLWIIPMIARWSSLEIAKQMDFHFPSSPRDSGSYSSSGPYDLNPHHLVKFIRRVKELGFQEDRISKESWIFRDSKDLHLSKRSHIHFNGNLIQGRGNLVSSHIYGYQLPTFRQWVYERLGTDEDCLDLERTCPVTFAQYRRSDLKIGIRHVLHSVSILVSVGDTQATDPSRLDCFIRLLKLRRPTTLNLYRNALIEHLDLIHWTLT